LAGPPVYEPLPVYRKRQEVADSGEVYSGCVSVREMKRRGWYAVLAGVSSLALLAPQARAPCAPETQQKVETPMARDERLEAPGGWPTKRSASREDYVGTTECARCHSRKTAAGCRAKHARAPFTEHCIRILGAGEPYPIDPDVWRVASMRSIPFLAP